jgi:hypothetical protein
MSPGIALLLFSSLALLSFSLADMQPAVPKASSATI